jgi:ABC-type spermidine/putrescine transport system permease subunit I
MIGSQIEICFVKVQRPAAGAALTLVLLAFTAALAWPYFRLRKSEGLV